VYGLFGFHFLLFMALRTAPPVEANLINYLWPLGMVVLAPLFLPAVALRRAHVGAALLGFCGAAVAILGNDPDAAGRLLADYHAGYVYALGSALVWATYSLATRRVAGFRTAAIGSFAAVSGMLSLMCHKLFEPAVSLAGRDVLLIAMLGIGPLGGAFFLWDAALRHGDPRRIGLLAFFTPLLSTVLIVLSTGRSFEPHLLIAAAMIAGAAVWGGRAR
jgi:drug/metabolite transporter (DMT)-like permease